MSNNPNGTELIDIGADFDDTGFKEFTAAVASMSTSVENVDEIIQRLQKNSEGAGAALEMAFKGGAAQANALNAQLADFDSQLKNTVVDVTQFQEVLNGLQGGFLNSEIGAVLPGLAKESEGMGIAFANAFDTGATQAKILSEQLADLDSQLKATEGTAGDLKGMFEGLNSLYGSTGGKIGPALPPEFDGGAASEDIGGGGSGGSAMPGLFGAAHGIRAASGLARLAGGDAATTAAFTGGADVLYLVQGLKTLGPIFESLNQTIAETPSIITPAVGALTALGVPMAGLLAAAVPVGVAVAALAAVIASIADAANKASQEEKLYLDQLDRDAKLKEGDVSKAKSTTPQQLNEDIQTKQGELDAAVQHLSDVQKERIKNDQEYADLGSSLNPQQRAALGARGQDIAKELETAQKHLKDLQDQYKDLNINLPPMVKAHQDQVDAVKQDIKAQEDVIAQDQQFAALDKLSVDAAKEKQTLLNQDIQDQQHAINVLKEADSQTSLTAEQHNTLRESIKKHSDALEDDQRQVDHLTAVSQPLIDLRQKEADAIAAENAALQQHMAFLEQEGKLRDSGTQQQLDAEKSRLEGKLAADQYAVDNLSSKPSRTKAEDTALEKYKADITQILADLASLNKDVAPIVEARTALEGMAKAADDFNKKSGTLQDQLATQTENAKARELNAEEQYIQGSIQDIEQRSKIATDEARKEMDLRQQLSNQITDIGTKLTNNEAKLSEDFARQQADDLTKENEQLQKVQTNGYIQSREDAIDHANRLRDIQRQTQQGDRQALLDRNFLKINQDKIGNQTALDKENEAYRQKEDKLARHLSDEAAQINTSMNNERAQQATNEKRKFADMQQAANQEIAQARLHEQQKETETRQAEQRQLADLTTSENYKIQLLQHNLQNELTLYAQQEQAKMKLLEATRNAIIAEGNKANPGFNTVTSAINNAVNAPGNFLRSLKLFGNGGTFGADEPFIMSENGAPESLGIGGRGYSIPGAAMVYPLQGGSVTPGKGGKGVTIQNLSIAVHESKTPQLTADAVAHMIQAEFEDLMGVTT